MRDKQEPTTAATATTAVTDANEGGEERDDEWSSVIFLMNMPESDPQH